MKKNSGSSDLPWESVLHGTRQATALSVALDVARRCVDRRRLSEALALAARHGEVPKATRWLPHGLATGDAGIALLCAYCDQCHPEQGWDAIGHSFLSAGSELSGEGLSTGLFSGLGGVLFAVAALSRGGARYRRALGVLDDALAPEARKAADRLAADRPGRPVDDFDLVSGASGLAAGLLDRDPHRLLDPLLTALVGLATPNGRTPRWATAPELLGDPSTRTAYPYGNLNCGLAHGIPGPLAVLALALKAGHHVPGQAEAVRYLADWLTTHRADDEWGVNWPSAFPLPPPDGTSAAPVPAAARSSWCYGSPGVARALWHAGEALDDARLRTLAVEAMTDVLERPVTSRHLNSAPFCHGVSGLLQVVLRFAHDTRLPLFTSGATRLVDQVLGAFKPGRPVGFTTLGPDGEQLDRPDLLDGATGVAMVLLAASTDTEPTWDRVFLLS
ncbi:lanthionine synthetase C family protein [Streptomyces sp. NPDC059072]|uniref:lanthionine synthetase C family protein n=1 Tax=Streptomyces sp. NPDC059072 TaxID=3346715 RepID=UPI003679F03E